MGEERITCITIFYSNSFGRLPAIKWKTRHEIVFLFSLFFPATNTLCQMENSEYLFPELARRAEEKTRRAQTFSISNGMDDLVCQTRAHTPIQPFRNLLKKWKLHRAMSFDGLYVCVFGIEVDWLMLFIRILNSTVCCTIAVIKLMVSMRSHSVDDDGAA